MKVTILGAGLAGISLAYFLQDKDNIDSIIILEKEDKPGGLCRSFKHKELDVDIGPHILFSKDKDTLGLMLDLLGNNKHELRRSNRIIHKNAFVQYPFENDLSKLPPDDCAKCLNGFLENPYRDYPAGNMLQYFLKTFGEGITNLYLRPYNEKIWKFDPAFMDIQMVERLPRPPDEDIIRSAAGETIDGYTHQLYFSYPESGGIKSLTEAFIGKFNKKITVCTSREVTKIDKVSGQWHICAGKELYISDKVISCIPVNTLTQIYSGADKKIQEYGNSLRYNNIIIAAATVREDLAGDNFAFMIADKDVIFHRLSKIDFLGDNYHIPGTVTYMMEYTYRDDDQTAAMPDGKLQELFTDGLRITGLIKSNCGIEAFTLCRFQYAYVIYDLHHKQNMTAIREYFKSQGIYLNGRFGNFEYWNMDKVVAESRKLAYTI